MKPRPHACLESLEPRLAPAGIVAVDTFNQLHLFDSATPGTVTTVAITGLAVPGTEKIVGLDYRPATGQLYALGINVVAGLDNDEGRIYTINPATGVATQVGTTPFFSTFADNNDYSFEVDPTTDRIRVISDRDNNIRVNPNDGSLVMVDGTLNPSPAIVGVAYANNFAGGGSTTLYGIDNATDTLVTISPTNNGTVVNVGALGVTFNSFKVGFDIEARTGTAYAVLTPFAGPTGLYTINLATGAATLVGAVAGNPSLNGMTVALPAADLNIVNNTTATYTDLDGDKVTIQITGAPAGATLSPDDFQFSVGQFGFQLHQLNLSDDGQEWARANISINAVPVGGMGDSFANVGFINAAGVDLGKVTVNGDLGRIDAGLTGNAIPGLASLNVQSFGVANTTTQTSTIVGRLGGLVVRSDFGNTQLSVTDTDGSITSIAITGNLDGRGATGEAGISASQSIGTVTINGSVFGGSVLKAGRISAGTSMGSLTVGGSIFGGTFDETGFIAATTTMGNVLIKGSIFGGTQSGSGFVSSNGNMGNVTIKGSIVSGNVVDGATDSASGNLSSGGNMGALVISGNLIGGAGNSSGTVYAMGMVKSVAIGGFLKGGAGHESGCIIAEGGLGNVTVTGDLVGGSGNHSGSISTVNNGSIASVTIGGSVIGSGNALTGILSDHQLGVVKIAGEVVSSRISAEGGTGTPAAMLAIKSLTVGLGVENSVIFAGSAYNSLTATNPTATLGPVIIGGDFVTSNMNAGAMAAITIKGSLDGRGVAARNGIFSLGAISSVTIGGNLFGGSVFQAGMVRSETTMGPVTLGGSIFGGTGPSSGNIEAGTTMGNVLVKGSIFGGTDDHTGTIFASGNMGNITIKGSIVAATVPNGASDIDSGIVYTFGNMGAVVIGGSLIGSNSNYSGSVYASGTIKSATVNGSIKGGAGYQSGMIYGSAGVGNVMILGDMIGGTAEFSGSVFSNMNIANVTVNGSLIGGHTQTGIISGNQLGAVKILGGMTGGRISAEGVLDPATVALASAIKSVTIGGTFQNALILGGYNIGGTATNADATIGAVTVGGNWIASSIVAGVDDGADNLFGTADDVKITEGAVDTLFSTIASVTIKGYAMGTVGGSDHFGITAEQVGAVKVGLRTFNLAPGTDTTGHLIGSTGDFRVKEV